MVVGRAVPDADSGNAMVPAGAWFVGRDGAVGHSLDPSQVPRIFKAMARRAGPQERGCKRDAGVFQAPMEPRSPVLEMDHGRKQCRREVVGYG